MEPAWPSANGEGVQVESSKQDLNCVYLVRSEYSHMCPIAATEDIALDDPECSSDSQHLSHTIMNGCELGLMGTNTGDTIFMEASSRRSPSIQPIVAEAVPILQLSLNYAQQSKSFRQQLLVQPAQNKSVPADKPQVHSPAIEIGTDGLQASCADTGPSMSPAAALVYHKPCLKAFDAVNDATQQVRVM
jgi:hypothetical protein